MYVYVNNYIYIYYIIYLAPRVLNKLFSTPPPTPKLENVIPKPENSF